MRPTRCAPAYAKTLMRASSPRPGASQIDFLDALTHRPASTGRVSRCFISTSKSACRSTIPRASAAIFSIGSSIERESAVITCSMASAIRQAAAEVGDALTKRPSISRSSASARTDISRSTIPRPTSRPKSRISRDADDACRRQQLGEGWFQSIDEVPAQAISMSVRQIMKSTEIIAVVPDARKAAAVKACVEGPCHRWRQHRSCRRTRTRRCIWTTIPPPYSTTMSFFFFFF